VRFASWTIAATTKGWSPSSSRTPSPLAGTEAHREPRPASLSRSSIIGTVRFTVVTTDLAVPQKHCQLCSRFGDVHNRDLQQLLQVLSAVFTETGQDDRAEGALV